MFEGCSICFSQAKRLSVLGFALGNAIKDVGHKVAIEASAVSGIGNGFSGMRLMVVITQGFEDFTNHPITKKRWVLFSTLN